MPDPKDPQYQGDNEKLFHDMQKFFDYTQKQRELQKTVDEVCDEEQEARPR